MAETVAVQPETQLPSLLNRVIGVITSPKATFEPIVRQPKVIAILALAAFVMGASQAAFVATERGQQAFVDMQMQNTEKGMKLFGITPSQEQQDQQFANMQKMAPLQKYIVFVQFFVVLPIGLLIISAIYWAIFNAALGGTATIKQVMAVCAHSMVIGALGFVFGMILAFAKGTMSTSPANIGLLLPMLPEGGFLASFLGMIDVFTLWSVIVTAIGLGVLYRRNSRTIAIVLLSIYGIIVAVFATFFSR